MPLDPERVQAVFWEAVQYPDPVERAAILDRECLADGDLRRRVEALLRAHDDLESFLNEPIVGPPLRGLVDRAERDGRMAEGPSGGAAEAPIEPTTTPHGPTNGPLSRGWRPA